MATDTDEPTNESDSSSGSSKNVGKRKFTDNREEKTPIDGTGIREVNNTSDKPAVRLKCPYCNYSVPRQKGAERKVRNHITQSRKSKHKDRNAFQEFIHVHAVDKNGDIVDSIYHDSEWGSQAPNGEETTEILPVGVDPDTRKGEILEMALLNPEKKAVEICEEIYGKSSVGYVFTTLKEHLSEEEYKKRQMDEDERLEASMGKQYNTNRSKTQIEDLSDYQQRLIEAMIRWPDEKLAVWQKRSDTSGGTHESVKDNHMAIVESAKERVSSGEVEGPPYFKTLPYDEENTDSEETTEEDDTPDISDVKERVEDLTDKQQRALEAIIRYPDDSYPSLVRHAYISSSGIISNLQKTHEQTLEDAKTVVNAGEIDGPPYFVELPQDSEQGLPEEFELLSDNQQLMLEARLRNEITHDATKSQLWESQFVGVTSGAITKFNNSRRGVIDRFIKAAKNGTIVGPPFLCTEDGEKVPFDEKDGVEPDNSKPEKEPEKEPELGREGETQEQSELPTEATERDESEPGDTQPTTPHPDIASHDTVISASTPEQPQPDINTTTIPTEEISKLSARIETLKDRVQLEQEMGGGEDTKRELFVIKIVEDFLDDVTNE